MLNFGCVVYVAENLAGLSATPFFLLIVQP